MRDAGEMLGEVATALAADNAESARKTLEVLRSRSPELVQISEQTGEDLVATSEAFMEVLLASLRQQVNMPWRDYEQRARDHGRLRAAQGVALESLIDALAVYRRATVELLSLSLEGHLLRDEVLALAQSRIEDVTERLTSIMARGYLDHLEEEHRSRESELSGLAALAAVMGRSLDIGETAAIALAETLAALSLDAGAIWVRERAAYRLAHTIGLEPDQVDGYLARAGPELRATVSAVGRSESRVDGVAGSDGWNALRAQLRAGGRTVGMMSAGTQRDRVFEASDLLLMAAVADQVAIALDRARQFSSEARTDHLTGLANRREFERVMEREVALGERHGRQLAVMMIDVDNLKKINDRNGHGAGDMALRLVAQELQRVVRTSDVCGRIGGDEFGVAMPETDLPRAHEVARRLRAAIQAMNLGSKMTYSVEVSIGIEAWKQGMDWQALCARADTELYDDKRHRKEVGGAAGDVWKSPTIQFGRSAGRRRIAGS
jgi:diguanylate cyclase (GGDEF)-like protein